ncbi:MAG: hypothetical protein HC809_12985, partial [Gammaproteobacteria bacterium]|nr:hypothetical protein [Gammaproteobacteria bacterium]
AGAPFGSGVALAGDVALIARGPTFGFPGSVYVFDRAGGSWTNAQTIAYPAAAPFASFGGVMALEGDIAMFGVPTDVGECTGAIDQVCTKACGVTIGSILTDLKNANRNSVECATLPPTGIFPRELLILAGHADFQSVFDPLMPGVGGVPVGAAAMGSAANASPTSNNEM